MFFGSGDEFRLNLKQPVDGDPTLRGNLGQGTSFRRLQTTWQRSLGAHVDQEIIAGVGTIAQDLSAGDALGVQLRRLRPVPARRVARALGSHVKLIGGLDGYADRAGRRATSARSRSRRKETRATSPARSPACRRRRIKGPYRTYRPAGYLEAVIQASERLSLVPGVRVDYYSEIDEGLGQPAADRALQAGGADHAEGAASGLFSQPPLYGETVAPVGNPNLGLSQAQHYGLGVEQGFGRVGSVSVEGFYKRLSDLEVNGVDADGNPCW